MAQELADSHAGIRTICSRAFDEMGQMLKKDLASAKTLYAPKSAIHPEGLAKHFVVVLQGSMLVAKVAKAPGSSADGLRHYKEYLKALFRR